VIWSFDQFLKREESWLQEKAEKLKQKQLAVAAAEGKAASGGSRRPALLPFIPVQRSANPQAALRRLAAGTTLPSPPQFSTASRSGRREWGSALVSGGGDTRLAYRLEARGAPTGVSAPLEIKMPGGGKERHHGEGGHPSGAAPPSPHSAPRQRAVGNPTGQPTLVQRWAKQQGEGRHHFVSTHVRGSGA